MPRASVRLKTVSVFEQLQDLEIPGFAEEHYARQQLEERGFFQVVNDYESHRWQ
jgi:hypothetical protein